MKQVEQGVRDAVFTELTEGRLQEALEVLAIGGWDEKMQLYAREEMQASFRKDLTGCTYSHFLIAIIQDKVVGVSAWAPSMCSFGVYELSWATVLPKWRHRGLNASMLSERLKLIRQLHGDEPFEVIVYTWENKLYEQAGFLACHAENIPREKKRLLLARFPRGEG